MSLYEWPVGGYRPIPPPEMCMGKGCQQRAEGMFSWADRIGRLHDWAGCRRCAKVKRAALDAERVSYRTGAYPEKEG